MFDAIEAAKSGLVITDFGVAESYLPYQRLKDITTAPKVWVVSLSQEDQTAINRQKSADTHYPVQVGIQKAVADPTDVAAIDLLVEFTEQLRDVVRQNVDPTGYSWIRDESIKGENDTPFNYVGMREGNYFENYFTAFFFATLP